MQPTDILSRHPSPMAAAAAADIVTAACQRSFALQAELLDQVVSRGLEQSRQAIADPRGAGTALPGAWLQSNPLEPVWRCGVGMMTVYQNAAASLVTLMTAQLRGADEELESLSRDAHDDVERASATAAAAAGTAMSHGLAAVGRIGEVGAQQAGEVLEATIEATQQQAHAVRAAAAAGNGRAARTNARARPL
jgi:hypothetical protein